MNVNQFNDNVYTYNIYDEYINKFYYNAINLSNIGGLAIKLFHIKVNESYNFDQETSIQTSFRNFKFDLYEFVPVLEGQPPMSQPAFDPNAQGTSYNTTYSFTVVMIKNLLPGDMFTFYDLNNDGNPDTAEVFKIRNINYIRSINDKYYIYQIDAEYAPINKTTLEEIENNNILKRYFYDSNLNKFIDNEIYDYNLYISDNQNSIVNNLNNIYNKVTANYQYCKLNSLIYIINKKYSIFKINTGPFMDIELGKILAFFDLYYQLQDKDPVNISEDDNSYHDDIYNIFANETIGSKYQNYLSSLKDYINENDEIILNDYKCHDMTNVDILRFYKENDQIKYEIKDKTLFYYYNLIYQLLFCYRLTSDKFYDDTILSNVNQSQNIITDKTLFYNINGEFTTPLYSTEIYYDPGQYISYQDGVRTFNPYDGVLGG